MSVKIDDSTLIFVQVVFRHGIRAPDGVVSYPGDPYENISYEPFGRGQLTKEGRKQCYKFGQELRTRYNSFLSPDYYESILEAHSSEVGRARTTLQLVLAGLFPPTAKTRISDDLNWQPINFNYQPIATDPLFGDMIRQYTSNINHSQFKTSQNSIEVIETIEAKLNWRIEHNSQLLMIFDIILSQLDLGSDVPEWATDIYPDKLKEEVERYLVENMARKDYLKNGSGRLMQKILCEIENKVKDPNPNKAKLILYSGHDVNLVGLMQILQFPELIWPSYIGSLTFELHNVQNEYYVKVMFIDGYLNELQKSTRILNLQTLKLLNSEEDAWTLPDLRKHVDKYLK